MPPQHSLHYSWFLQQLYPHDGMLRAWLRAHYPATVDFDDIVQEAYLRVLRAHDRGDRIESPKAFLFATARNLALMQWRHRQVEKNDVLTETVSSGIMDETCDVPHAVARAQELEILTQAIQCLPTRCRQIITLRKIYGLSQKEVAARLSISEHTVEAQGTIGLRKLAEYFERLERKRPFHE